MSSLNDKPHITEALVDKLNMLFQTLNALIFYISYTICTPTFSLYAFLFPPHTNFHAYYYNHMIYNNFFFTFYFNKDRRWHQVSSFVFNII